MNKITAYKSITGLVSEDENEVKEDERIYLLRKAIEELVEKTCWSGMSKSDVESIIFENRDELKRILK